ncbi:MAG: hypothetical protein IJ644_00450 [Oscillospiraceae bacterium]|nr:hypothetical protein [Oscillospiraceae bacterium]
MIKFNYAPDGIGEGIFKSRYFRDDMGEDEFLVYIFSKNYAKYAEECIQHFNALPESVINDICQMIIDYVKQDYEDFSFPAFGKPTEILNYCGFGSLEIGYPKHGISYVIQGEGDWGEMIGFVVTEDTVTYVGKNYLPNR